MLRLLPGISSLLISIRPVHSAAFFSKSFPGQPRHYQSWHCMRSITLTQVCQWRYRTVSEHDTGDGADMPMTAMAAWKQQNWQSCYRRSILSLTIGTLRESNDTYDRDSYVSGHQDTTCHLQSGHCVSNDNYDRDSYVSDHHDTTRGWQSGHCVRAMTIMIGTVMSLTITILQGADNQDIAWEQWQLW